MSKTVLPLHVGDISSFARSLGGQLADCGRTPGHVELLNMLARSSGHKNFQHLRASALQAAKQQPAPEPVSQARLTRLARLFDAQGRLSRWPGKRGLELSCLWVVWSRIPARHTFSETELNDLLNTLHSFGDHALVRRGLCDFGLMTRTADGREYKRVEQKPSAEALALLERLER
ncbi:MAG: DUF2087 domain-containing protein [Proteobacteria bacterium]|nr:DUF2087 domain-containing protein [Pseudomonadota bacterium]MBU1595429.1 DUF2087 domain-containing protein [Pseudomonadota bacterium]